MQIRHPWPCRADRRLWRAATTFSDLGELTARWLEGDIRSRPGIMPNHGPDDETLPLIPRLAAANRAGFLTDDSQPGHDAADRAGNLWEQRAAVTGFVADPEILTRLVDSAEQAGLDLLVRFQGDDHHPGLLVSRVNGLAYTWYGRTPTLPELRDAWPRCLVGDTAARAAQLTLAALAFEPGDILWTALDEALHLPSAAGR
ncbi:hypothetical protein OHA84_37825 (plasmid) [Streptomyces sp. NBC_00513]|uniref:DUF6919 domain-containing protein n=1 Tax=unclassified Streptomyces TaxID=2593676 RepID=UPI002257EECF|nr:hypothetical protein [Streptomyces sp. NBC_00424]MCX5078787.1 hypothetical protein [Streptomyces sp. NBC_00424]WUD46292.1 hypothetical protein OHA84_37825 [Streptomyces sp. NBC_00513]